jgi:uroporphyrin-3 C-methyltransferase
LLWLFGLVAIAALALAGWQWWENRQQLADTRDEMARQQATVDAVSKAERDARVELRAEIEALQGQFDAVASRQAESESQGEALRNLYEELTHGREEAILLDVEQALTLAGQQLQLAGNVAAATLALQTVDARLARLDKPRYLPLRSALAKDLARLKALPLVDVTGISLRLEEIITRVDQLPLLALERPTAEPAPVEDTANAAWWRMAAADAWQSLRSLVRIQRIDGEEPVLLAPEQNFFLRENLKLRLLNARLALLSREHAVFRSELNVAQGWLQRHFTPADPAVKEAQEQLQQLLAANPGGDLPGLDDSLAALVKLRSGKDAR